MTQTLALWYRKREMARLPPSSDVVLASARRTVTRKKYCLLATRSATGVNARVVQPWRPDHDFTVWLGVSPTSRKIRELQACDQATLVYEDDSKEACVVFLGRTTIVTDPKVCKRRFKPMWNAFFPKGPEEDFVAIKFVPDSIEVINFADHVTTKPFGLKAMVLQRTADGWSF